MASDEGGGIAYGAHLGGFMAGVLLVGFFKSQEFRIHNPLSAFSRKNILDQPQARPAATAAAATGAIGTESELTENRTGSDDALTSDQNQRNLDAHQSATVRNVDSADLADPDNLDDYSRDRNRLSDLE